MSTYPPEKKWYFKELINRLLVFNPGASTLKIQEKLVTQNNVSLSYTYVNSLLQEIYSERAEDMNTQTLTVELQKYEATVRQSIAEFYDILKDTTTSKTIKISAIKSILDANRELLNVKFDAGVFSKKLGELDIHNSNLTEDELKQRIRDIVGDVSDSSKSKGI